MTFLISYLLMSYSYSFLEKKIPKKIFIKIILVSFIGISVLAIIMFSLQVFLDDNSSNCGKMLSDYSLLEDKQIDITLDSVSLFPEISNIRCFGTLSSINNFGNTITLNILTSELFLNYFNVMYGFIFIMAMFYVAKNKFALTLGVIYLFVDYTVNIYFFQLKINYLYIFIKLITILFTYHYILKNKDTRPKRDFFIVFTILLLYIKPLDFNLHPDDLYYLGYSVRGDSEFSAFFGNEHLLVYKYLVGFLFEKFEIYSVFLIKIFLSLWLALLIIYFSKLFELKTKFIYLLTFLIILIQSFAAGDQLWGSFVPKNFAYLFMLSGIYFILNGKLRYAALCFIFAAYFQLAAFIIWLPIIAIIYIYTVSFKEIVLTSTTVVVATSPLLYSLYVSNFLNVISENEIQENLIYLITTYMPNHMYPFVFENTKFIKINPDWLDDFRNILFFVLLTFTLSFYKRWVNNSIFRLIQINTLILLIFLLINFLFPISTFMVLSPYKIISALAVLLNVLIVIEMNSKNTDQSLAISFIILVIFTFTNLSNDLTKPSYIQTKQFTTTESFKEEVQSLSAPVLILPLIDNGSVQSELLDLEIFLDVDTYVSYKYFPQIMEDISTWKIRINNLHRFYEGECDALNEINTFFYISNDTNSKCGMYEKTISDYKFYKYSS